MSQVHKVIILNQPLKIRGYSISQWLLLVLGLITAFILGSNVPGNWKIGNLPAGFLVGLSVFCLVIVFVFAFEIKPYLWWRNLILYRLNLLPRVFRPSIEPSQTYPEPVTNEPTNRPDEYYVSK